MSEPARRRGRPRQFHERDRAIQLHLYGLSIRQVAAEVGTSPATVFRLLPKTRKPVS